MGRAWWTRDGDTSDWFEVFNPSADEVDLDGWYASDDAENLTKWEFPNVQISPGEYVVVFASNKDRARVGDQLHTNFRLAARGEPLLLVET